MSMWYSVKEAFSGMARAKISTLITVFTCFFLIFILAVFGILSSNVYRMATVLNANSDMQAYLSNTLSTEDIERLKSELEQNAEIKGVKFISKEDAAKEFKQVFGEDIFDALEENPLPASFVITLHENSRSKRNPEDFAQMLQRRAEIDEVVLPQQSLNTLLKFSKISRVVLYALFFVVFIGSFFMISNTIRLIIFARRPIIETMQLVGATNAFIRRPFIIQGIFQGFLGGAAATLVVYLSMKIISIQWPGLILVQNMSYLYLLLSGIFFGLSGSLFAVKRFL